MKEILMMVIPIISTFIGVLLGWGCTELSRYFANSYQKRQTLNSALSLLLELYYQMKRIQDIHNSMQDFLQWYMKFLDGKPIGNAEKVQIQSILNEQIPLMITSVASDDIQQLSLNYEQALEKMSYYYPVVAYRLRGRADIQRILVDMNAYYQKIREQLPYQVDDNTGMINTLHTFLQPTLIQDNISSLKEDILDLAQDTNSQQRKEIQTTLGKMDEHNPLAESFINLVKEQISDRLNKLL